MRCIKFVFHVIVSLGAGVSPMTKFLLTISSNLPPKKHFLPLWKFKLKFKHSMVIIEWAKFILKTRGNQLTVEAMTCVAIKTNFDGNKLY